MKTCTKCCQSKPFDAFYVKGTNPRTGHTQYLSQCRACTLAAYVPKTPKPKPPPRTEKTCRVCAATKNLSEFYNHTLTCRACISDKNRANRVCKPTPPLKNTPRAMYMRERRRSNPLAKLRANVGTLIANVLSNQGYKKTTKSASILGCSFDEFSAHIESQFLHGMSWSNRALWHIDHIVPVKLARNEPELLLLNHYSNLRPLWKELNQTKASTLTQDSLNHPLYKQILENRISG